MMRVWWRFSGIEEGVRQSIWFMLAKQTLTSSALRKNVMFGFLCHLMRNVAQKHSRGLHFGGKGFRWIQGYFYAF